MSLSFKPQLVDVAAFAQTKAQLSDTLPLSKLERLAQDLGGPVADLTSSAVAWQAQGEQRQALGTTPQVWLHLSAQASLPMTCQRCLGDMLAPVAVDRWFRFVATEEQALQEDDQAEEDLLVISKRLNLLELLEDELLMQLPMVPKHDTCPQAPKMSVQDADFDAALEDKPKPFAGLGVLKKG